jgi:hypothetical protein
MVAVAGESTVSSEEIDGTSLAYQMVIKDILWGKEAA